MGAVLLLGEDGALFTQVPPFHPGVQQRLDRGDIHLADADGNPADDVPSESADQKPSDAPSLPRRSASQSDWADFAAGQGMDAEKAHSMTRRELMEEFRVPLKAVS